MKKTDLVIVGAGPAGLFTAYRLASSNCNLHITVIDKGKDIYSRKCPIRDNGTNCVNCKPCNIMCGFGGAGTFSDCKLSLTPYNVGGNITNYITGTKAENYIKEVESIFSKFDKKSFTRKTIGKKKTRKYKKIEKRINDIGLKLNYCPTKHLGTDGTLDVMKNLYEYLKKKDIEFIFNEEVVTVNNATDNNEKAVVCKSGEVYFTKKIILAPGRSGNTWLNNLAKQLNIPVTSNGFDVGFRVEVPAKTVKELTDNLYDMKIYYDYEDGVRIRTFCTNPKGFVSEEHYDENITLANGHSFANKKSKNTNFAVLVHFSNIDTEKGKEFLKQFNEYSNNSILMDNYYELYKVYDNFNGIDKLEPTLKVSSDKRISDFDSEFMSKIKEYVRYFMKLLNIIYPGITNSTTNFYGMEAKFYSNLIGTDNNFETCIPGIYCIGDGAGITRGIMQAASCGLIVADHILESNS